MSALYNFQTYLALKLSQRINKAVTPAEITLGAVVDASSLIAGASQEKIIEVFYKGNKYLIAYTRFDLNGLLEEYVASDTRNTWNTTDDKNTILANMANRAGIILDPNAYTLTDVAAGDTLYKYRTLSAISDAAIKGDFTMSTIGQYFTLARNYITGVNSRADQGLVPGSGATTSLAYVNDLGYDWLRSPAGAYGAYSLGATMSWNSAFTVDMMLCFSSTNTSYKPTFSTDSRLADATLWDDPSRGYGCPISLNSNKLGWYWNGTNAFVPAFSGDVPFRLTIRRISNTWYWYINGALKWTYNWTVSGGFQYFIVPRYNVPSRDYIRQFRYWNQAISDVDLKYLFKKTF